MSIDSMYSVVATPLLAMAPAAAPGTAPNPQGEIIKLISMVAIMGFMMYFIVIRPQRQRQKQLDTLMKSMKSGDKVLTASGLVGVVITVKEKTVSIRCGESKLEVLKSTVSEITEKAGAEAEQS